MALAWKAGWVNALRGSNPLSSATGPRWICLAPRGRSAANCFRAGYFEVGKWKLAPESVDSAWLRGQRAVTTLARV
jgi:hypothetical protein